MILVQFSVSACANQATGFSMNGSSTPNSLLQTINGLLETAPSTVTWCIVPFNNRKSWTFCQILKLAVPKFLGMWKFCGLPFTPL